MCDNSVDEVIPLILADGATIGTLHFDNNFLAMQFEGERIAIQFELLFISFKTLSFDFTNKVNGPGHNLTRFSTITQNFAKI